MLYVGIDWASDHHDVGLTNDSAETLAAFRIAYGSEGFERLHRVVSKAKTDSLAHLLRTDRHRFKAIGIEK